MFAEYLDVVRRCWEDGPTTYRGRYVDIEDIWVIPKPVQRPGPPIYVAVSTSPESVDYAAKLGVPTHSRRTDHDTWADAAGRAAVARADGAVRPSA